MPCNDDHSISSESGGRTNGGTIADAAPSSSHPNNEFPASSSSSSSSATKLGAEEMSSRRVNIISCDTNAASVSHSSEQHNSGGGGGSIGRIRSASTRSCPNIQTVFSYLHPLPGEELDNDNWVDMESCTVFLTQYRIIVVVHNLNAMCAIPLGGVDWLEAKDIVGLQLYCRDGRIIKLRAQNSESAFTWYKKLTQKTCSPRELSSVFAFKFFAHVVKARPSWLCKQKTHSPYDMLKNEFSRLKLGDTWKITAENKNFEVCASYPQYLIVPSTLDGEDLKQMGQGRHYKRFPTLVWRCAKNGAVLLRSSQPTISFFGTPNDKDVNYYHKIRSAISPDDNFRFFIADARSYTAALANRTKGGGFEPEDYYTNANVVFMGLPNIHYVRQSFFQLQQHLNSADQNNFYHGLYTSWLQYIFQLFASSERCLNSLLEGVSVLVHCSDGWDRTTQIVSLCMLILDPFYRTFEGFEMLIQRQWVEFGHKFADRCGILNGDCYEKSPVFLQFLDCVFQLWMKNQNQFQFNRRYLMKLMQTTFSGLFGTFIFNSLKEASENGGAYIDPVEEGSEPKSQRCFQVWQYLGAHNAEFENPAYDRKRIRALLQYPKFVHELEFWRDVYFCTQSQSLINNPDCSLSSLHHNTGGGGTGSNQDIATSADRANSTLSRSQSAASLHSLEQSTSASFHSALGGSAFMNYSHSNGTNSISSSNFVSPPKSNDGASVVSFPLNPNSAEWKSRKFLDVDGLSKFSTQYEDYIIERDRERELQTRKAASPVTPNPPLLSNGKMVNGSETSNRVEILAKGEMTSKRIRNESVDSSTFEMVNNHQFTNGENGRMKHSSHNSTSSLTSGICLPSSCSSTCTTLSNELCAQNGFGCKNGVLQESVENGEITSDGIEILNGN